MKQLKKLLIWLILMSWVYGVSADYNTTFDNPIWTDIWLTNPYIIIDLWEPSDEQYCIELWGVFYSSSNDVIPWGMMDEEDWYSYWGIMLWWTPWVFVGGDTFFTSITCTFAGDPPVVETETDFFWIIDDMFSGVFVWVGTLLNWSFGWIIIFMLTWIILALIIHYTWFYIYLKKKFYK